MVFNPNKPIPTLPNTAKVVGEGGLINGVFGGSKTQTGVVGHSETSIGVSGDGAQIGVFGFSSKGIGVFGESNSGDGIGVNGKGGRFAGLFEGNVKVTGDLNVQGHSISQLLQRIENLENQIQILMKRLDSQQPIFPSFLVPRIGGSITVRKFNPRILKVAGSRFSPNFGVIIRVVTQVTFIGDFSIQTDGKGEFDGQIEFDIPSVPIFIAARDNRSNDFDLTGFLWSNTASVPEIF